MKTADFEYDLARELIAQHSSPERDAARMLMLDPSSDSRDCSNLASHRFGRALDGSFLKQFALPRILRQRRGALELGARLI